MSTLTVVPTFTIKLGLENSPEAYLAALSRADFRIGAIRGSNILKKIVVSHERTMLDLAVLSVSDLGFEKHAKLREIYAAGIARGYKLCPDEAAIVLRLSYPDQIKGEHLCVAMDSSSGIFLIVHDYGGLWLTGDVGDPEVFWPSNAKFVFVKPRRESVQLVLVNPAMRGFFITVYLDVYKQ